MSYSQFIPSAHQASGSSSNLLKVSTILSLTTGLVTSGLYYLYLRATSEGNEARNLDQLQVLKNELEKELRIKPI